MCLVVISISASCSFIVHYVWGVVSDAVRSFGGNKVSYHGNIGEKVLSIPAESDNGGES